MYLAILMTNTDESAFAQVHPQDGEKFTALIRSVRPEWRTCVFSVKDDVFPDDITAFDGVIITGSPASVHDPDGWVARLLEQIRQAEAARVPMFGACLGHQAIALALGGAVTHNPSGWAFGVRDVHRVARAPWDSGAPDQILYAAHIEQVTQLPRDAETLATSDHCPIAGFRIADHVFTTQYHPEMTHGFITALVEELSEKMGAEVTSQARASLKSRQVESAVFAQSLAQFFEHGAAGSGGTGGAAGPGGAGGSGV